MVMIGLYATDVLHATTSQAGLITGIFIIGTLIGRIFIGPFLNSLGLKKTLLLGLFLFTLTTLIYFVNFGIVFFIFTRFIHGITLGIASTGTGAIVGQNIPLSRKGEGISYFTMGNIVATAIGPFFGLYLLQQTNFTTIFLCCLILGIISCIIGLFVHVDEQEQTSDHQEKNRFYITNIIDLKALPISIVAMGIVFCYSSVVSFINFYAIELDLVHAASFFFIVYSVAVFVSRPITGRLMDVKGTNFIMYPAFIMFGAGMLILSLADNSLLLLLSGILFGLGYGNMQSCTQATAIKLVPSNRIGIATSTYFIFLDAGFGLGPYLIGFVIPFTGLRTMYSLMCILILAVCVLYYFLYGKKEILIKTTINASSKSV